MNNIPNIFHIGTQRAGSTFLFNLLKKHPQISLSKRQEIHYYTSNFEKSIDWYLNQFDENKIMIDTSPKLFQKGYISAKRIYNNLGKKKPKFILVLRNPIDYINSHFRMHLKTGFFKKHENYSSKTKDLLNHLENHPEYLDRALYAKNLKENWLDLFDIKKNFKIIFFNDLINNKDNTIKEILGFLDLKDVKLSTDIISQNKILRTRFLYKIKDIVVKNDFLKETLKGSYFFNEIYRRFLTEKDNLSNNDRKILKDLFKDDVKSLEELLGKNVPWKDFRKDKN